ncbi:recombinase family protein [Lichenibacterium dinghuense]|uniref:recombinase family protein n=1 Tax=Lichenibacterium dinghuense TaxID=2895977 RepID=UPI001F15EF67|nr:recombinase family protein [Lichenibacterium sp. 6Y81]
MIVGYARTSTTEQVAGFEAQDRDLRAVGAERIFSEQVSSVAARPELEAAIGFVRQGDVFAVTKLDRLARSVANLLEIVARLEAKGVTLRILNLGLDTATPTGKLMLTVMGGVAEFERSMMLERQREGIAKAKAEGAYKGRKPTSRARSAEVAALKAEGRSVRAIAEALGISVGSVHGMLRVRPGSQAAQPMRRSSIMTDAA